jgi:hypothetical protein
MRVEKVKDADAVREGKELVVIKLIRFIAIMDEHFLSCQLCVKDLDC